MEIAGERERDRAGSQGRSLIQFLSATLSVRVRPSVRPHSQTYKRKHVCRICSQWREGTATDTDATAYCIAFEGCECWSRVETKGMLWLSR